ncbi:MAG TPA: DUF494 family protein [Ignavibacteria bacterium]|nr:DUF494 family protein [Ignavibacteria bacterium]
MYEKVIEIIEYLLTQMNDTQQITEKDIIDLEKKGYSSAEINTAFVWLNSKLNESENIFKDEEESSKSKRFFHQLEKNLLTTEAMGYILQMSELGVINNFDIESIIEKLHLTGITKASIPEVKSIISSLLFDAQDNSDILNRMLLQNNDTIN